MEFTRSSDSAIVAIKVVIVTGLNFLAGLAMQNYLVAITYSNSEVSQRTVIAIAGQSLPFEVAAASEGSLQDSSFTVAITGLSADSLASIATSGSGLITSTAASSTGTRDSCS